MYLINEIITSQKNSNLLLSKTPLDAFQSENTKPAAHVIHLDPNHHRQEILGFGGAFTEAMALSLNEMPTDLKQEAMDAYFHSEKGIGYSFCRTHIHSCDFSRGNYTYIDEGDDELKSFSITRDEDTLIPLIQNAQKLNPSLKLFASPWSPPAFMKTSGRMLRGGRLKYKYYETWARYLAKYIKAYKKAGIDIWGLTLQNEANAITPWESCQYTHGQERDFLKVTGKVFEGEGLSHIKLIFWDHNKNIMKERADIVYSDREAFDYAWGMGFHWYGHDDGETSVDNSMLDYIHSVYPEKGLIFTEGCNTIWNSGNIDPMIGEWWTGERYARHICADLNHWTQAWCDWNMVLNEMGGPNHVNNVCDAPIIADSKNKKLIYESSYYMIAHFSKYILPGSKMVYTKKSKNNPLHFCAALRPDDKLVWVIFNDSDKAVSTGIEMSESHWQTVIEAHSIKTVILEK